MIEPSLSGDFATLMEWADQCAACNVRANADTPLDAETGPRSSAPKASASAAPSICSSIRSGSARSRR